MKKSFVAGLMLIFAFTELISAKSAVLQEQDSSQCCSCHEDAFSNAALKMNIHQPYLQRRCRICHEGNDETNAIVAALPVEIDFSSPSIQLYSAEQIASAHLNLKNPVELSIATCQTCHSNINLAQSHPVFALPPEDMRIPSELPLLKDGRMTCLSCHEAHDSNTQFRLRKSDLTQLCLSCHPGH